MLANPRITKTPLPTIDATWAACMRSIATLDAGVAAAALSARTKQNASLALHFFRPAVTNIAFAAKQTRRNTRWTHKTLRTRWRRDVSEQRSLSGFRLLGYRP